jgi:hypothetical protein
MSRLEQIRDRLNEITTGLGDPERSDTEAAELAAEAAVLTSEAARLAEEAVESTERGS